jgi:hypothetical protein
MIKGTIVAEILALGFEADATVSRRKGEVVGEMNVILYTFGPGDAFQIDIEPGQGSGFVHCFYTAIRKMEDIGIWRIK